MTPVLTQRSRADRGFERLYRRHAADVYRYALAVLRSPQDAEDVTQTTFLNAYRAYQRGERPRRPQNWLIAIAHNVCRQRFRQKARRPSEVAFNESDAVAESFADDDGPSVEDIRRALGYLSFNQRAALVMREVEGRSYVEIAEILDISVSAVETLIFRARRALREQLEGSLTCHEAELAVSRQLDGRLPRSERGALRAHLRECRDCAAFARSQRAQRTAIRTALGLVPLPGSLASFFGGTAAGTGIAAKTAAVVAAGALVGGAGYESVKQAPWRAEAPRAAPAAQEAPPRRAADGAAAVVRAIAQTPQARLSVPAAMSDAKSKPKIGKQAKPAPVGRAAGAKQATTARGKPTAEPPGAAKSDEAPGQAKKQLGPANPQKALRPSRARRAEPNRASPKRKPERKPKVRANPRLTNPPPVRPKRKRPERTTTTVPRRQETKPERRTTTTTPTTTTPTTTTPTTTVETVTRPRKP